MIIFALSQLIILEMAWRMSFEHIITVRTLRTPALSCLELLETFMAEASEPKPEPGFRLEKSLTMENCDFTFPGGRHSTLKNLNLTIKRGEKVGLIGASRAGKAPWLSS